MSDRQPHPLTGGIVAACLLGWIITIANGAEGQIALRVVGGKASCDGKVAVPVELSDPNGLGALDVVVRYDADKLEFEQADKARALAGAMFVHKALEPGKVRCGLISTRPIEAEGAVFTLHFRARGQAGKTTVELVDPQAWQARHAFVLRVAAKGGTWDLQAPSLLSGGQLGWIAAGAGVIALLAVVFLLGRRSTRRRRPPDLADAS